MPIPVKIGNFDIQRGMVEPLGRTYLFYGPFGSGKTHTAATAIALGKCLWIITDANTNSILLKFPSENVDRIYITRYIEELKKVRNPDDPKTFITTEVRSVNPTAYKDFCAVIDDLWVHNAYDYDFVIIDSITTVSEMCLDWVQLKNSATPIDDAPQIQHYGEQIRQLMARCGYGIQDMAKATKITVIVICHDRVIEERIKGQVGVVHIRAIQPALTGMAGRTIGKEYEEVWYFKAVVGTGTRSKTDFEARTRGTGIIAAKTQIDDLPDIIPHKDLNMKYVLGVRDAFIKRMEERK